MIACTQDNSVFMNATDPPLAYPPPFPPPFPYPGGYLLVPPVQKLFCHARLGREPSKEKRVLGRKGGGGGVGGPGGLCIIFILASHIFAHE